MGSEGVSSLYATEKLPQPYVVTGIVDIDIPSRTLAVRLSELEHGYGRVLWKAAHQQLRASEENGYRTGRLLCGLLLPAVAFR
jgi:hypothetical protein